MHDAPDQNGTTELDYPDVYTFISNRLLQCEHLNTIEQHNRTMRIIGSLEWEGSAEVEIRTSNFGALIRWRKEDRELELKVSWTVGNHIAVQRRNDKPLPGSQTVNPSVRKLRGMMKWLDPDFGNRPGAMWPSLGPEPQEPSA